MTDINQSNLLKNFPDIIHGFSTAKDGNMSFVWGEKSEVINNRRKYLQQFDIDLKNCVMMHVEHKDEIKITQECDKISGILDQETACKIDALMTNKPDICLCLLTADCLPIIFYDQKKKIIALGHMGWQGTDQKLSQKIIKKMENDFRSEPKDILVAIGPGIHKESYIFTRPVAQEDKPEWRPYLTELPEKKLAIDIISYNFDQLLKSGISPDNIEISPIDTFKDQNTYSHYRSLKNSEPEGRFMTIIKFSN